MKKNLLSLLFLSLTINGYAQSLNNLPKDLTPLEKEFLPNYFENINPSPNAIITPPSSPVRTAAEWEEIQALTITWTTYQSILKEIIRYAQTECKVYIVCSDSNAVQSYLASNSVPLTNLIFVKTSLNSIWCRDYGANTVYTNDVDSLLLVDWTYNRPRAGDDAIPVSIANKMGVPLYQTTVAPYNLIHTGGNFMSDGLGTAFSSKLVLDENPTKTEVEIDDIMNDFMGINTYIKMNTLPYDGIHHIDMHMKLLDEETLLIGKYPAGIADGPQIEANLQYVLSNFNSVYGTPYKIIRIVQPPDQYGKYPHNGGSYTTYTNAVFVNKTVILPLYYQQYDTTALRVWKQALPGYKIVGINCNNIIQASGAIHCITNSVGVSDPLLISHQQLTNTVNTTSAYQVNARIQHKTGISNATLFYRIDTTQSYQSITMNLNTSVAEHNWTSYIPAQAAGTKVYYYIHAQAVSGKQQVRPLPAPSGFFSFNVYAPTSIESEISLQLDQAFPNPSKGLTCVPIKGAINSRVSIKLYDILGNFVLDIHQGNLKSEDAKFFFDSSSLSSGAYLIVAETGIQKFVNKIMVK